MALTCLGALVAASGCGGGGSSTQPGAGPARAAWASRTERLCVEKRAAIASLGYVHITYGGIARVGLPAVKRSLDRYLARLLAVLRDFAARQGRLATPAELRATMTLAGEVDAQSELATLRAEREVASAGTAAELTAAFRAWLEALKPLAARGDVVARQLHLPACRSGAASP